MSDLSDAAQLDSVVQQVITNSIAYGIEEGDGLPDTIQSVFCACVPLQKVIKAMLSRKEKVLAAHCNKDNVPTLVKSKEISGLQSTIETKIAYEERMSIVSKSLTLALAIVLSRLGQKIKTRKAPKENLLEVEAFIQRIETLPFKNELQYPAGYLAITRSIVNSMVSLIEARVPDQKKTLEAIRKTHDFTEVLKSIQQLIGVWRQNNTISILHIQTIESILEISEIILQDEELVGLADETPWEIPEIFSSTALEKLVQKRQNARPPLSIMLAAPRLGSALTKDLLQEAKDSAVHTLIVDAKKQLKAINEANVFETKGILNF